MKKFLMLFSLLVFAACGSFAAATKPSARKPLVKKTEQVSAKESPKAPSAGKKTETRANSASSQKPEEDSSKKIAADSKDKTSAASGETEVKPLTKEELKKAKKKEKELARFKANAVRDDYLGMLYLNVPEHSFSGNAIAVKAAGSSFNVYVKTMKGKEIPLFTTSDLNGSFRFFVKIDRNVYDLNNAGQIRKQVRQTEKGAQIVFTAKNVFQIAVDLSIFPSKPEIDEDAVLVDVHTTNLTGQPHNFAVKVIADTLLGENTNTHFITFDDRKVNQETEFKDDDLKRIRYLISSDGKSSVELYVSGKEIAEAERVVVANPAFLEKMDWDGFVNPKRSFNNISGYNNSAVMIEWKEHEIAPKTTVKDNFYIFTATDGAHCKGVNYIEGEEVSPRPEPQPDIIIKPFSDDDKSASDGKKPSSEKKPRKSEKKTDVDFVVPPIKEYQLDPEYIQKLIDKIDSLQSDSGKVNKNEIARLNAELDAILEKIRQMNESN